VQVPQLCMEDWDLADRAKFPHFEPSKYLKMVYYEEVGVTRVEPMTWATGIQCVGLLNMLTVPHFGCNNINTICVCQLLTLVHDGALWLGERIPIDTMLIRRITVLPCAGADPTKCFCWQVSRKEACRPSEERFQCHQEVARLRC
jgi:hypothetical protein